MLWSKILNKKIETWLNKVKNKLCKIQEPWLGNPNGIPYSSFCVSQSLVQGKLDLFQETLDTSVQATDKKSFSSGQHALDMFKCYCVRAKAFGNRFSLKGQATHYV